MRSLLLVLLLCYSSADLAAQDLRPGEWRTYTSMRSVSDVAYSNDSQHVWAATSGGGFRLSLNDLDAEPLALRNTDGLTDNELSSVAVDANDNVYFGGLTGSFDIWSSSTGRIRRERGILDAPNFSQKQITDIFATRERVYIATGYGLTIYEQSRNAFGETVVGFGDLPLQSRVVEVIESRDTIYAMLNNAVAFTPSSTFNLNNPAVWTVVRHDKTDLKALVAFKGSILIGSETGLFTFTNTSDSLRRIVALDSIEIADLQTVRGETLQILSGGGMVTSTDLVSFQNVGLQGVPQSEQLRGFIASASNVSFATLGSGVLLSNGLSQPLRSLLPAGPVSNLVVGLDFADGSRTLYSTHVGDGISLFDPETSGWKPYSTRSNDIPRETYTFVTHDSIRNVAWVSTSGAGIFKFSGLETGDVQSTRFARNAGFSGTNENFLIAGRGMLDSKGRFVVTNWASNGNALSITEDGNTFRHYFMGGGYHPYGSIAEDQSGSFWVGTTRNTEPQPYGVFYRTQDSLYGSIFGGAGGVLASRSVNALHVDQDNALWAGTDGGLDIIADIYKANTTSNAKFTAARRVPFLADQIIRTIEVDGVGNKWVGTENGIFVVSADGTDSVARFSRENSPLIDNVILTMAIDTRQGEAYIGTAKGMSRVSTVFKQGAQNYEGIKVYPNPVVQTAEVQPTVFISGLVAGSSVGIYTASGRLVARVDGENLGSIVSWNGKDETGRLLPSGVYLVSATSTQFDGRGQAKLVLIRD